MADVNQPAAQSVPVQGKQTCIWAILGLIFAFVFSLLGLIFSIIALQKIKADPKLGGRGLALAGLIISIIGTVIWIIAIIAMIVGFTMLPANFGMV